MNRYTVKTHSNWVTWASLTFTASILVMGGYTAFILYKGKNWQGLCINMSFLTVMAILLGIAVSTGFTRMQRALADFTDAEQFVRNVEDISIQRMWKNLSEQPIVFSDSVTNTNWKYYVNGEKARKSTFFDRYDAVISRFQTDFCNLVPALLTTLGILGTFVGLALSMNVFGGNIDNDTITKIISGMNVAFYTSIYGIALSFFFNLFNSKLQSDVSEAVSVFLDTLDRFFTYEDSSEAWNDLKEHEQKIEVALETISDSISDNLGRNIGKSLGEETSKSFNQISGTLRDVLGDFRMEQARGMKSAARVFTNEVTKELDNHIVALGKNVDDLSIKLDNHIYLLSRKMDEHIDSLGTSVQRFSTSQEEMTNNLLKLLAEIEKTSKNTENMNASTSDVINLLNSYLTSVTGMTGNLDSMITTISNASQDFSVYASNINAMANNQTQILNSLAECSEKLSQNQGQVDNDLVRLEDVFSRYFEQLGIDNSQYIELLNDIKADKKYHEILHEITDLLKNRTNQTGTKSSSHVSDYSSNRELMRLIDNQQKILESINFQLKRREDSRITNRIRILFRRRE